MVYGTLSSGRIVRLLNRTPATASEGPGWEVGLRYDDVDGQWVLTWLADADIVELEVR